MNIIEITPPTSRPEAELIAEDLLACVNSELGRRIENHTISFHKFWDSSETPDAIAAAMGDKGKLFIMSASQSLVDIGTLAAMVGKTLDDAILPENYAPRRKISFNGDTIVLASPAEGFDAWGKPI
jgi:hypothetical protein